MLRATGRYADAWFPVTFTSERYADGLQQVQSAADDANRDPRSIIAASWHFVVTGRSSAEVEDALESVPIRVFALNFPAWAWAEHGERHPMGDDSTGFQDFVPQTLDEQTALAHAAAAPVSALKQYVLNGTSDEVIDQLAVYRDQGVRYPVLCNISLLQPKLSRGVAATLPLVRILRGLRKL